MVHEIRLNNYRAECDESPLKLGTVDSYGIEQLHVALGEGWSGLVVTATFVPRDKGTRMVMSEDGMIDVPPEATQQHCSMGNPGKIVFAGITDGVQRITTNLFYYVDPHAKIEGAAPAPTPDEFTQLTAEYQKRLDAAVPPDGELGQVLTKTQNGNAWQAPQGGGSGESYTKAESDARYAPLESAICPAATGNPATIKHTLAFPIQSIKILGLCTQAETPQNGNVVPIQKFDGGTITVEVTDGAGQTVTSQLECPSALLGADPSGVYDDYIDPANGHVMTRTSYFSTGDMQAFPWAFYQEKNGNVGIKKNSPTYWRDFGILSRFHFVSGIFSKPWEAMLASGTFALSVPKSEVEPYGYVSGEDNSINDAACAAWIAAQPEGALDLVIQDRQSNSPATDTGVAIDLSPLQNLMAYSGQTTIQTTAGTAAEFSAVVNGYQWIEDRLQSTVTASLLSTREEYNGYLRELGVDVDGTET